jgi:hypothetical protein
MFPKSRQFDVLLRYARGGPLRSGSAGIVLLHVHARKPDCVTQATQRGELAQ